MKVAIIHDWLVSQRGGENVLDAICELFPQAQVFTLIYSPGHVSKNIENCHPRTSILQSLPSAVKRYRHFLPLMPWAIERFDLTEFDLVISSSHCVAKGVRKNPKAFHLSYVHAPMRYMWDRFDEYFGPGRYNLPTRIAARGFRTYLQNWDRKSATRVDSFLVNSKFIAEKVMQYYGRDSKVVYPFCEPQDFLAPRRPTEKFLIVTALVPYKRVDLAIETFNQLRKQLVIIGDGPDLVRLKKMAGPTIEFMGSTTREKIAEMYSQCRALVFPGIEDFGIVPLEAMAAGSPVIAFAQGGVLETVTEKTGVFFEQATVDCLKQAIFKFENMSFDSEDCRRRGRDFTRKRFQTEFLTELRKVYPLPM